MSRRERAVAFFLLTIAIAGGALIPRLLSAPAGPLEAALEPGLGASRTVVQAPAIPTPSHRTGSSSTPQQAAAVSPVLRINVGPTRSTAQPSVVPPTSPAQHAATPTPPPPSPPASSPPPAPLSPPAPVAQPSPADTRPGHGYGDSNHLHTGPRAPAGRPAGAIEPARRNHGRDLPGSGHGRPVQQAPSQSVGTHHRGVGHLAPPAPRPASPAPEARPKARPRPGGPRGKDGHGPPPPVTHGHGQTGGQGNGQHGPTNYPPSQSNGQPSQVAGQAGQANGHSNHGKGQGD